MPAFTATATGLIGTDNLSSLSLGYTLNTTATAASPAGTYNITFNGGATETTNYGPITYVNGILTVTPGGFTGGGGGGGGGGGVAPVGNLQLEINMWDKSGLSTKWLLSGDGILQENASQTSLEGLMTINISKGSKILDVLGNPLTNISVVHITPPAVAPEGYHILDAFAFSPAGATFVPGIEITVEFNASAVGADESVVIAYFNEATGKWEFLKGTIVGDGTAKFTITHFSTYAVMAGSEDLKVPEPTVTPTPAPVEDEGGIGTGVIIAIVVGILVVLVVIGLLLRSRKTKKA